MNMELCGVEGHAAVSGHTARRVDRPTFSGAVGIKPDHSSTNLGTPESLSDDQIRKSKCIREI